MLGRWVAGDDRLINKASDVPRIISKYQMDIFAI